MEERLKLFLAMEGLSPSQFADKLGVQRSGVSHLLAGRNKPSFEFISKMLAAYPKINPDWLIMGTGRAYRDMPEAEIAGQAGNDAVGQAGNDVIVHAGNDVIGQAGNDAVGQAGNDELRHTRLDRVSEAPLQENPVTDNPSDLFSINAQSPASESTLQEPVSVHPDTPPLKPTQATKPEAITAPIQPKIPSDSRTKQPQVIPAPGKRIAQITILYTDGTYEVR